jgi:hypothetical protein
VSEYKYYLCTGAKSVVRGKRCGISMKAAEVEELVYGTFLERWGDDEVTRRVYHAGEDHTAELEQVRAAIARIQHERDTADDWDDEDEEVYETRMRFQRGRRKELKALPQRAAGWTEEPTGKTYMREWGNQTPAEKLKLMKDHGIRFELFKDKSWHLYRIEPEEKALTRNAGS